MSDSPLSEYDSLPPEAVDRIDALCDRFEAAWKTAAAGEGPRIEDYLDAVPEGERAALLRELVLLDVHYRARRLPFVYNPQDVAVLVTSRARPGLDGTLVAGLDLASIGPATGRLVVTGLAVSGGVILVIACLGAVVIRVILRPVAQVQQTVEAVAAGESARRVPEGQARSQPGSLACSVNSMLTHIEQALTARAESEAAARRSAEQMRRILTSTGHQLRKPLSIINGAAAWYRHRGQRSTGDLDRIMRQVTGQAARIDALTDELRAGHDQPRAPL